VSRAVTPATLGGTPHSGSRQSDTPPGTSQPRTGRKKIHPAWIVAGVAFIALVGAAGFRAAPSVLMVPLQDEFGWSRGVLSLAVGVNLVLFGLTAPFAAALMDKFGIRKVTAFALTLVALGSGLTVFITADWQLVLLWGFLVGLGTGSMALVFAATIANRWFVTRRGLVMGILTAGSATGQLIFLPVLAWVAEISSWRTASLIISAAALAVVPLVVIFLRNHPSELGVRAYGDEATPEAAPEGAPTESATPENPATENPTPTTPAAVAAANTPATPAPTENAAKTAINALRQASHSRTFWALMAGFAICGATTNGLIGTHFVPAAHDHGLSQTTAAGLLAVVGIFDIIGTIGSGILTDKVNPRTLLACYYFFRGVGLVMLPFLLSDSVHLSIVAFVIVYGLDWVATVPPTVALCRELFGMSGTIVFGWVFAAHQIGAAVASVGAGVIRDLTGEYTLAWFASAGLCVIAAFISFGIRRTPIPTRVVLTK